MALPLPVPSLVFKAFHFAATVHRDQRRRDAHQSPYINHPLEAAHLLVTAGVTDVTVVTATLLHDVLEETVAGPADVERVFGADVRRLVEEVTDPPNLGREERRRRQLEGVRTASSNARLIRLADKVAALSAMPCDWDAAERRKYLQWMSQMGQALKGTNAHLEAQLTTRLREAWARTHEPPRDGTLRRPATRGVAQASPAPAPNLPRLFARLQSQLSNAEELADQIAMTLSAGGARVPSEGSVPPASAQSAPSRCRRPRRFADPKWRALAEPGVGSLAFTATAPHAVAVSIDGAPAFTVTPTLAKLLHLLASGAASSPGAFPSFQRYESLAEGLHAATGRPAGVRAVVVGIARLRERLLDAGHLSPMLVETSPGKGARFRLRGATG